MKFNNNRLKDFQNERFPSEIALKNTVKQQ